MLDKKLCVFISDYSYGEFFGVFDSVDSFIKYLERGGYKYKITEEGTYFIEKGEYFIDDVRMIEMEINNLAYYKETL